jgi:predicted dinucleotide-binding enzyme
VNIFVLGRGNVGGGLARRWERAGHAVTAVGRDGGDATDAEVVVVAVPSGQIADALGRVSGLRGKVAIDTTNPYGGRNQAYPSLTTRSRRWSVVRWPRRSTSTSRCCMTRSTGSGCGRATCMRPRTAPRR